MKTIVHMSDIHFGDADAAVVERLVEKVEELEPDLVVVSGDLTQRARRIQYRAARAFLDRLPRPQLVVPGNHDVPLYDVFNRFLNPLRRYKKFITDDLAPEHIDDEIAVFGVNTARSLTIKGGRVSEEQVEELLGKLCPVEEAKTKLIVTHHPFDLPEGFDEDDIVGRAKTMMPKLVECGADIFLAGHLHVSHITHSAHRYRLENGYSALVIQAGTAASRRERGEDNSFNVLEIDRAVLTVKRFQCTISAAGFRLATTEQFGKTEKGWARL
ncbi:MAG TPA: metallophosphoesterase family protein [Pyrinomonadaceae bacterium]|nr:metallophosphoesterase family protein [Pyrinomonadaceae bacterium]